MTSVVLANSQVTVPFTEKVLPSVVSPASDRVLPLVVMAVYLGTPVGVALLTVMADLPVTETYWAPSSGVKVQWAS